MNFDINAIPSQQEPVAFVIQMNPKYPQPNSIAGSPLRVADLFGI
jgi:hypothetical protein